MTRPPEPTALDGVALARDGEQVASATRAVTARQATAWPVWHCPTCRAANDNLRHTCRPCAAHRPCEHADSTARCGATPVHLYPDGPKCDRHGPAQPDTSRLDAGPDPARLGATWTFQQWAGTHVAAWQRTPRDLYDQHGRARPNPARETTRAAVRDALDLLAGHLDVTPDRLGPCLNCPSWTLRYGGGGRPLCPACRPGPESTPQAAPACP